MLNICHLDLDVPVPEVSLESFCSAYRLNDQIQNLKNLQFIPGTPIDDIEDWKEYGFTSVSWSRLKNANRRFLNDVVGGKWPATK